MIWEGEKSKVLPGEIQQVARRKLRMINNAENLNDLRIPPANRLKKLKGEITDFYSIRINDHGESYLTGIETTLKTFK